MKIQKLETCDNCENFDWDYKKEGGCIYFCYAFGFLDDKRTIESYPEFPKWCPLEDYRNESSE